MICNQLSEAKLTLAQLSPQPSPVDITRAICGSCERTECCPCLKLEQREAGPLNEFWRSMKTGAADKG